MRWRVHNFYFEMKEKCKVSCVKLVVWSIVAQKGSNMLIFYISKMVLNMVLNVVLNLVLNTISFKLIEKIVVVEFIFWQICRLRAWKLYQKYSNLSLFLNILGTSISKNISQQPLLTVVSFSRCSFPQKSYIWDRKTRDKEDRRHLIILQARCNYNISLFQTCILIYNKPGQVVYFIFTRGVFRALSRIQDEALCETN